MSVQATTGAPPATRVTLRSLMPERIEKLDTKHHADEAFDYYSLAAFASGRPEAVQGAALRASAQVVQASDVLLSRIVSQPRRAWVVGEPRGRRQLASDDWLILRSTDYDPDYLRHLLVSNGFHLRFMRAVASAGKTVRARPQQLAPIALALPSLPRQQRIARVLDQANALRAQRRAMCAALEALPQAMFHDLFGEPAIHPQACVSVSLTDISTAVPIRGQAQPAVEDGGALMLAATSISGRVLDLTQATRVALPADAARLLADGDLLLAQAAGARIACGASMVVYPGAQRWTFDSTLLRLRFDRERVVPEYVLHYLRSARGRATLARAARGPQAAARIDALALALALARVRIALPSIARQRELARRLAVLEPLEAAVQRSAAAVDALLGTLRDRAFLGMLEIV